MNFPKWAPSVPQPSTDDSIETQMADIAQHVRAAKDRGDQAKANATPHRPFPPTASNIFANNAIELLTKREDILNKAIALADELDLLAQEQIACGLRLQDFMRHAQEVTLAVVETQKVLAQCPPSTSPQPSPTNQDGTSTTSGRRMKDGDAVFERPAEATGEISPEAMGIPLARQS